jgi:hypothetical protein
MSEPTYSLRASAAALARGWHSFFHAPCDARVCALVRIAFALVVLTNLATLFSDRHRWFSDQGVLTAETSKLVANPYGWSVFWWQPNTPANIDVCFGIAIANAALLLVGLLPRVNALCLFVWLLSLQMRNPQILDGEDTVMRMIAFFLIWMPSGQCWSLNAVIRRGLGYPLADCSVPSWSLRLLQIQTASIFLSTALMKLAGDEWLDGTALYYVARLDDFFGRFPVPAWLFDTPWVVALMTWGVVLVELTVPLLIWFRETRRTCLIVTLLFHLANEWTMHLFLFHWIMLVGWLSFVTTDDLALLGLIRKRQDQA